jgi:thiol-disulfide isomerase/thioredoxin
MTGRKFGRGRGGRGRSGKAGAQAAGKCSGSSLAPRWLMYGAFALVAVLALVLAYRYMLIANAKTSERFSDDGAAAAAAAPEAAAEAPESRPSAPAAKKADDGSPKLVFLYMDGCVWCERFKPQWEQFKTNYAAQLSALGVKAVEFERKEAGAAKYMQHVDGYPTVLFDRPQGVVKYDGQRTPDALIAFVEAQK